MCMASVGRQPIDPVAPTKKHPRDDGPPLPPHLSQEPLHKRPCPDLGLLDTNSSHLGFLEELYEFENSLDASAIESVTQEELLTEMMKSLERVIGSIDENPLPELPASGESSHSFLIERAEAEDVPATAPNCSSDLDLHSGLLMGSPSSPVNSAENLVPSVGDDWPSLDVSYSDFVSGSSVSPSVAGGYLHDASEVWLDDNFGQLDDTFTDCARDNCDLTSLDSVF